MEAILGAGAWLWWGEARAGPSQQAALGSSSLPCHWSHESSLFPAGTPQVWWVWLPAASRPQLKALSPAPCPCPTACPQCPTRPTPLLLAKPSSPRRIETIRATSCSVEGRSSAASVPAPGLGQAPAEEAPLGGGGAPETVRAAAAVAPASPTLTSPVLGPALPVSPASWLSKRS